MTVIDQDERYARMLRAQQAEQERDRSERQQLWAFVWILASFKFVSIAILVLWIEWDQWLYIAGMTTWWWILVPGVALSGPVMKRLRMHRVRRKRNALKRAEFEFRPARRPPTGATVKVLEEPGTSIIMRDGDEPRRDDRGSR